MSSQAPRLLLRACRRPQVRMRPSQPVARNVVQGRRGYASSTQDHPAESSDTPWIVSSVVFGLAGLYFLRPSGESHHDPHKAHEGQDGAQQEEPSEKAPEKDHGELEKPPGKEAGPAGSADGGSEKDSRDDPESNGNEAAGESKGEANGETKKGDGSSDSQPPGTPYKSGDEEPTETKKKS